MPVVRGRSFRVGGGGQLMMRLFPVKLAFVSARGEEAALAVKV